MSEIQCHCCPGSKRLSEIKEELSRVRLEDKQMSAQSKAMYWQARAMELEAMAERMAEALQTGADLIRDEFCSHSRRHGCGDFDACYAQELYKALDAYAAMKGGK